MNLTEKRRSSLISFSYFAVFIVCYYLFVKYAFWIVAPFIFAFVIAMVLQRPVRFISKKTFLNKKITSVILVVLLVAVLLGLLALIGYNLYLKVYEFAQYLISKFGNYTHTIEMVKDWVTALISHLPHSLQSKAKETIDGFTSYVLNLSESSREEIEAAKAASASDTSSGIDLSVLSTPLSGIWETAKQVPVFLTALLIGIISCFFMTSDYDGFTGIIKHAVSEEHEKKLIKTKRVIIGTLGKWCRSYALILFITFCEVALGLSIFSFMGLYDGDYIFVIALCTAFVDILPVFGTGTIMVPWAVISMFTGKIGLGIALIILYALITVIRQIIEPKLVSANVGMHPVITLMAMYIGIQVFGVFGIIILPITLVVIKTLNDQGIIHLWGRKKAEPEAVAEAEDGKAEKAADAADAEEKATVSAEQK